MRRTLALLALAAATLGLGCTHVRPWQRENLARMQEHADQLDGARAYEAHFWMVREAAVGGTGKPAGGCGCN